MIRTVTPHPALLLAPLLLLTALPVRAQAPAHISYQGYIENSGAPVDDPGATLAFRLLDADGTIVWSETHTGVRVSGGLFDVRLGTVTPLTGYEFHEALTLEVDYGGTALGPRTPLGAAPYALGLHLPLVAEAPVGGTALLVNNTGGGSAGDGIRGETHAAEGRGLFGQASAFAGTNTGVYGLSHSSSGRGVYGGASSLSGATFGVVGESFSPDGTGVRGVASAASGGSFGVYGLSSSTEGRGVYGVVTASSGTAYGMQGVSHSADGIGVRGIASAASGVNYGVYGSAQSSGGYAGYFQGRVHVTGVLSKGGGAFEIDHPLDPANRVLRHSFVESPDMMNVYNGNITLDAGGAAVVVLPDYFEALNRDFRYQLTALGTPMPGLHVAGEVQGGRFRIAGGVPGGRVSWQVAGVRNDAWADEHRIVVEEDKRPALRGRYLHPGAFGLPEERGMHHDAGKAVRPTPERARQSPRE